MDKTIFFKLKCFSKVFLLFTLLFINNISFGQIDRWREIYHDANITISKDNEYTAVSQRDNNDRLFTELRFEFVKRNSLSPVFKIIRFFCESRKFQLIIESKDSYDSENFSRLRPIYPYSKPEPYIGEIFERCRDLNYIRGCE